MGQKGEKLFTDSNFSEKFRFPTLSSLLWLFLLKVDHVNGWDSPTKWHPEDGRFLLQNNEAIQSWTWTAGGNILPGKSHQRRRKVHLIELRVSSSSSSSLLRFPFGSARRLFWFEINNIFVFLKRHKWQNCFFLYIHIRLFRHETQEILFISSDVMITNFRPLSFKW